MSNNYHINIQNSTFNNGSSVVSEVHYPSSTDELSELLRDLKIMQSRLENTEPLIANALYNLQQALEGQNKPKISKIIGQLTSKTVVSVLSAVATPRILSFLGIS